MYALLIFSFNSCSKSKDNIEVLTIRKKIVSLDSLSRKIVLVFNHPAASCSDCFKEIHSIIARINQNQKDSIYTVLLFPYDKENIISTRFYSNHVKQLLFQDTTLYDKPIESNSSIFKTLLFNRYKVEKTPCVLLINGDNIKYISDEELFVNGSYNINLKVFEEFYSE